MGILRNIIIGVSALSFITFVALFGQLPALRKTPIGWLQRALCVHLPHGIRNFDRHVTGGRVTTRLRSIGNYLFYKKNPAVLILFLFLLSGSAGLFLWSAVSQLPTSLLCPIPVLLVLPYFFTWLSVYDRSHYITPTNHGARLHDYPYDHVIFKPRRECSTCRLVKPARSKHCSLCGVCVAMCDHHCPWINNCVGRGNYRYFLALLLSLGVLEMYGAFLSYWILRPALTYQSVKPFISSGFFDKAIAVTTAAIDMGGLSIAGVGMLALATFALPLGLLAYHCYLIWAGMTTNESQKWADWREDIADGCVFKASREELRKHGQLQRFIKSERGDLNDKPSSNTDVEMSEDEPYVLWPVQSAWIIAQTTDGRSPLGRDDLWSRVWSLSDLDNIYDLGGWDNFMAILCGR